MDHFRSVRTDPVGRDAVSTDETLNPALDGLWGLALPDLDQGFASNSNGQDVFSGLIYPQFDLSPALSEGSRIRPFDTRDTPQPISTEDIQHASNYFGYPVYNADLDREIGSVFHANSLPQAEQSTPFTQDTPLMSDSLGTDMSNIRQWFNQPFVMPPSRTFPRRKSIYRMSSPLPSPITLQRTSQVQASLDPMQRWENSPPAEEGISMSAIAKAIADADVNPRSRRHSRTAKGSRPSSHSRRATSVSSLGSAVSSRSNLSIDSVTSAVSSSDGSRQTQTNRVRKPRQGAKSSGKDSRIFQCTFCCDTFKSKYDWMRHEKSLHLVLEKWTCTPDGGTITNSSTGDASCAYCDALNPTLEHLNIHDHSTCSAKPISQRTFRRKDHLKQHMRLVHGIDNFLRVDEWKSERSNIRSRCGFCNEELQTWNERAQHLSSHFRQGKTMADWRGTHGFDPDIESRVTNAVPPYLLGDEAKSLIPYSVTNPHSQDHLAQITFNTQTWADKILLARSKTAEVAQTRPNDSNEDDPDRRINFVENLTRQLGRYAQEQVKAGVIPTDEMFQQESRRIMFGEDGGDDPWNQTMADSREWLQEFRRSQALDSLPSLG